MTANAEHPGSDHTLKQLLAAKRWDDSRPDSTHWTPARRLRHCPNKGCRQHLTQMRLGDAREPRRAAA